MANRYLRELTPWPAGVPVPANAQFIFYDQGTDDDYRIDGERVADEGNAAAPAVRVITANPLPPFVFDELGTFVLAGREGFYRYKAPAGGTYAVPTGPDDANWKQVAPPVPAAAPRALMREDEFLLLAADAQFRAYANKDLYITDRANGGGTVVVRVLGNGAIADDDAYEFVPNNANAPASPVSVRIVNGQVVTTTRSGYDDTALRGRVSAVEADVNTLTTDLDTAETELLALDGRVDGLETTQQQHTTQIAQNRTWIGTLGNLATNARTNLVAAINELFTKIGDNTTAIGFLPSLQTSQKGNLVAAINEVKNSNQTFGAGTGSSSLLRLNQSNSATSYQSSVLAGESSSAIGQYSTVISGYLNVTRGHWSVILGGSRNVMEATANGNQAFGIIAGSNSCTTAANFCGIYNSSGCSIAAGCDYTTLIGCKDLSVTAGSNQTYINNQLVGSNSPAAADLAASGTVIQFTTKFAQYGPLASGTFTLDAAGAVLGATVSAFLTATASSISVPTSGYQLDGGAFVAGKAHRYMFHVERDGLIHYLISSY